MLSVLLLFFKWFCRTLTPEYFQHLNTRLFFKTSVALKVHSHCNFLSISGVCNKNNGKCHAKKSFLAIAGLLFGFLSCRQAVVRDSYKWVSYKKGFDCCWWWIYFGWWWVVVDDGGW